MKSKLKLFFLLLLTVLLGLLVFAYISFLPIATGMAAKTMCSCVYATHRNPKSVRDEELSVFPGLSSATIVFGNDSSVTARLLGRSSKAIYRKGVGCTLLAQRSEDEVRHQTIHVPLPPPQDQNSIPWPSGNLLIDSLMPAIDKVMINKAIDSAFRDSDPSNPVYTHAVVVVYKGQIVGEKYAPGFSVDSRLMGWSMTKSFTNAMVGILVKEGKLKISDPAPVPEWLQDERRKITINNLLLASSGLKWSEVYLFPGDFHNMFTHSDDKGGYAAGKKLKYAINEHFEYSSGTTNLLQKIIRQTVGDSVYYRLPYEKLFYKIGMNHALLEADASGTFVGSSYGYASARDWARFGLLFAHDGVWNGERILPEGWVSYSFTPAPAATRREYGAQWWLNQGAPSNPGNCWVPGLPPDAAMAIGFEEQYVVVIPSLDLVVVRLGVTHNKNFHIEKLVNGIMRALPQ